MGILKCQIPAPGCRGSAQHARHLLDFIQQHQKRVDEPPVIHYDDEGDEDNYEDPFWDEGIDGLPFSGLAVPILNDGSHLINLLGDFGMDKLIDHCIDARAFDDAGTAVLCRRRGRAVPTRLRVPHGQRGKVIDVRVLNRSNRDDLSPGVNEAVRVWIAQTRKISVGDKMAGRHGNKGVVSRILPEEDMPFLADGTPVDIILNPIGVPSRMNLGQVLETHLGWAAHQLNFRANTPVFDGASDNSVEDALARVWFLQQAGAIDGAPTDGAPGIDLDKAIAWLAGKGYDGQRIFDHAVQGEAQTACLQLWLKEVAEVDPTGLDLHEMHQLARDIHRDRRIAPPTFGKMELFDGRTGERFDQAVTVGHIYILKLIHLVEDKIHARSTGPYSMITQQPLGGKAQFGGQRFGEMEVWALEAYSAAYNLQEVLTVKSDDVAGRVKTYEAVVKGEPIGQPGVPESFNVLLKELQSLGLSVELLNEDVHPSLTQSIADDSDLYQPLEAF